MRTDEDIKKDIVGAIPGVVGETDTPADRHRWDGRGISRPLITVMYLSGQRVLVLIDAMRRRVAGGACSCVSVRQRTRIE